MKQFLPYNVLLIAAFAVTGAVLVYNTLVRESYATTLRYEIPAVEQQTEPPTQPTIREILRDSAVLEATEATEPETEPVTATEPETEPATATEPATEPETEPTTAAETEPETQPPPVEEEAVGVQFPLDINAATLEEILLIPDVGNAMAQKIVQYRDYIGGAYDDLAMLKNISGVGEATYAKLWAYFYISEGGEAYAGESAADDESSAEAEEEASEEA